MQYFMRCIITHTSLRQSYLIRCITMGSTTAAAVLVGDGLASLGKYKQIEIDQLCSIHPESPAEVPLALLTGKACAFNLNAVAQSLTPMALLTSKTPTIDIASMQQDATITLNLISHPLCCGQPPAPLASTDPSSLVCGSAVASSTPYLSPQSLFCGLPPSLDRVLPTPLASIPLPWPLSRSPRLDTSADFTLFLVFGSCWLQPTLALDLY
ncbi:hypothetical protein DFH27DRAFT_601079 [Peziza echinospora]|nr:hypothetical protein DFH27DRAFT_601079 [Peziza echinospora]